MNCIKMLKFTLSALLLTATTATYAQESNGEVTLKDNKTVVSWAQFVNAINNPSSIQGAVSEESEVAKLLAKAKEEYQTAKNDSSIAAKAAYECETAYNTANDRSGEIGRQITLLQSSTKQPVDWLETAYTNATAFQKAYANVVADENYTANTAHVWMKKITGSRSTVLYN